MIETDLVALAHELLAQFGQRQLLRHQMAGHLQPEEFIRRRHQLPSRCDSALLIPQIVARSLIISFLASIHRRAPRSERPATALRASCASRAATRLWAVSPANNSCRAVLIACDGAFLDRARR